MAGAGEEAAAGEGERDETGLDVGEGGRWGGGGGLHSRADASSRVANRLMPCGARRREKGRIVVASVGHTRGQEKMIPSLHSRLAP